MANYFFRLIIVFCFLSNSLFAEELLFESPENSGLSPERIDKIENVMNELIDEGAISGAVTLVARHNKVGYLKAFGTKGAETEEKMAIDQIFRIASMSKAVTTVGAMTLFEKGYFLLDDPVSTYIPEFTEMKVMVLNEPDEKEPYQLVDAKSPITIRHLLTQTSGITYGFFRNPYFHKLYKENNISDGLIQTDGTIGDMVKRLSKLPLMNQPGKKFTYGLNTDVLGYLIEVVSGMSLDQYLKETIFDPLNMNDTYFFLPDDKVNRLATINKKNDQGILKEVNGEIVSGTNHYSSDFQYNSSKSYYSGGAGLVSTASDYYKLLQMLLNKGELDGKRTLG